MKLQVITAITVISGIFTTSADAGGFNLGKAIRTAQTINRTVNNYNHGGGRKITYPSPNPPRYTNPGYGHKPVCKPKPPVYKPLPHPGHGHKPCPPVNRPPVKCYKLKLINGAGAEVYYTLNKSDDYTTMPTDDVDVIESHSRKPHLISYHNGHEVVEYELAADATYSFEWDGDTLQLSEIRG